MRIPPITILFTCCLLIGCWAPAVPPTDNEMLQHFYEHERAFDQIKDLIPLCSEGSYYPPYFPDDTACLKGIPRPVQEKLDSLLVEIGCERIFYFVKTGKTEYGKDTTYIGFSIPYFISGFAVGGTSKNFEYSTLYREPFQTMETRELNDIHRERYNDTILYKSIKVDWFITLLHDN